jgi:hypothetical protein
MFKAWEEMSSDREFDSLGNGSLSGSGSIANNAAVSDKTLNNINF